MVARLQHSALLVVVRCLCVSVFVCVCVGGAGVGGGGEAGSGFPPLQAMHLTLQLTVWSTTPQSAVPSLPSLPLVCAPPCAPPPTPPTHAAAPLLGGRRNLRAAPVGPSPTPPQPPSTSSGDNSVPGFPASSPPLVVSSGGDLGLHSPSPAVSGNGDNSVPGYPAASPPLVISTGTPGTILRSPPPPSPAPTLPPSPPPPSPPRPPAPLPPCGEPYIDKATGKVLTIPCPPPTVPCGTKYVDKETGETIFVPCPPPPPPCGVKYDDPLTGQTVFVECPPTSPAEPPCVKKVRQGLGILGGGGEHLPCHACPRSRPAPRTRLPAGCRPPPPSPLAPAHAPARLHAKPNPARPPARRAPRSATLMTMCWSLATGPATRRTRTRSSTSL